MKLFDNDQAWENGTGYIVIPDHAQYCFEVDLNDGYVSEVNNQDVSDEVRDKVWDALDIQFSQSYISDIRDAIHRIRDEHVCERIVNGKERVWKTNPWVFVNPIKEKERDNDEYEKELK